MARMLLILAGLLMVVAFAAAKGPPGFDEAGFGKAALFSLPNKETYHVVMGLQGLASNQVSAEAYAVSIDLVGDAVRDAPRTDAQQEHGSLDAYVKLLDQKRGTLLDAFTVPLHFDAERSTSLKAGTDGWKFTLHATSPSGLAVNLHGMLTGLPLQDGHSFGASDVGGVLDLPQAGYGTARYDLSLAGHATEDRAN